MPAFFYRAHLLAMLAFLGLGLFFVDAAFAASTCQPTPSLAVSNYPRAKAIPHGNNLLLPAGKSVAASGQKVVIVGRLLDSRCLPITEAVVEIWQVDPYGRWLLAGRDDLVTPSATFAGAGRTITDKDGRFVFTTAFPAALAKRAPHINMKVKAQDMKEFSTMLFFANDSRNAADATYKKTNPAARDLVTLQMGQTNDGGLTATTTIVLSGKVRYRTY